MGFPKYGLTFFRILPIPGWTPRTFTRLTHSVTLGVSPPITANKAVKVITVPKHDLSAAFVSVASISLNVVTGFRKRTGKKAVPSFEPSRAVIVGDVLQ